MTKPSSHLIKVELLRRLYIRHCNIFGKVSCPKCNGDLRRLEINKRRAFVCEACQPLPSHVI